ncbi:S-adenosylmethionine--2-demethylmenaquinone methyltransferase [Microbacterium sp. 1.5R]|uniref:ribonuclease E activity regulator RraA n=1 Tax=Microbacterium sp. 1.5R TaxID=1916917 RepID=UPI000909F395|nr:ribonuclease E activity regulator RraA [Microbacterium sp. 1.5R]APH46010.1 S-adenosylmethionine--2-demethylmenaquinone methyltransferase [Microbacterium sp. 1.5R]
MTTTTADVYDEQGHALDSLTLQLQGCGGVAAFDGPIRTIQCFRDNALVRRVLATPGDGSVLVIDGGGSLESALVGDVIAASAVAHGWGGLVINGAIRDRAIIGTLSIGVKALGTNPVRSSKEGTGEIDLPVTFGGVRFMPGAHLWADGDGVLVERIAGERPTAA